MFVTVWILQYVTLEAVIPEAFIAKCFPGFSSDQRWPVLISQGSLFQYVIVLIVNILLHLDRTSEATCACCLLPCHLVPCEESYLHLLYNYLLFLGRLWLHLTWIFSSLGWSNPNSFSFFHKVFQPSNHFVGSLLDPVQFFNVSLEMAQSCSLSQSLYIGTLWVDVFVFHVFVSPAKLMMYLFQSSRWFLKILDRTEPSIDPQGTICDCHLILSHSHPLSTAV